MGLVQEDGLFAEHRAGYIHASDLHSIFDDLYSATPEEKANYAARLADRAPDPPGEQPLVKQAQAGAFFSLKSIIL
jgi:hypothetical protein